MIEIDSHPECYEGMIPYLKSIKSVPGLSCEVGLRRGGGTHLIMKTLLENDDKRTHVAIDPYGTILYSDIAGVHRTDYTNQMRSETLSLLYKYSFENDINFLFFNLEDSEFYSRFIDGVPVYEMEKSIESKFAFVHIDGQHDLKSVFNAACYFKERIPLGGIIAFDNTDNYEHFSVDQLLRVAGFELLETLTPCARMIYRKM